MVVAVVSDPDLRPSPCSSVISVQPVVRCEDEEDAAPVPSRIIAGMPDEDDIIIIPWVEEWEEEEAADMEVATGGRHKGKGIAGAVAITLEAVVAVYIKKLMVMVVVMMG